MVKCNEYKLTDGLILNPDNIWVLPLTDGEYIAFCGDTQYTFSQDEVDEVCDKINAIGCTSFRLSKEELATLLEKIKGCS